MTNIRNSNAPRVRTTPAPAHVRRTPPVYGQTTAARETPEELERRLAIFARQHRSKRR